MTIEDHFTNQLLKENGILRDRVDSLQDKVKMLRLLLDTIKRLGYKSEKIKE